MCTLIAGIGVLGPGTLLVGANRDESPTRPSAEPGVLLEELRVVGGRDLKAGGTWLAIRDARRVTALMNRRPHPDDRRDPATFRSRGLLCLEAAALPSAPTSRRADAGAVDAWLASVLELARRDPYGDCTLVGLRTDGEGWAMRIGRLPTAVTRLAPGWHVITHQEINDPDEPRTRWLMDQLRDERPADLSTAIGLLQALLTRHGEDGSPPVCLHRDIFPTVSSSILALGDLSIPRYLHASGPPCVTEYRDRSALL